MEETAHVVGEASGRSSVRAEFDGQRRMKLRLKHGPLEPVFLAQNVYPRGRPTASYIHWPDEALISKTMALYSENQRL
jgi:hypothetical protein